MGHYSDYYEDERERQGKIEKDSLELLLKDFQNFRMGHALEKRYRYMRGQPEEYFNKAVESIKAKLYDLGHY